MHSCFRGVAAGRYPLLKDREDLWRVLVTISAHKALDQLRAARAAKRGSGHVRGESVFDKHDDELRGRGIERVVGEAPTPEFAVRTAETCRDLLCQLDDSLRTVVVYRLEGYSNVEIARKLDCSLRTVERKLARVRQQWGRLTDEREAESAEPGRIDC
jgi:DNA-directed RNA polymerase specialized sigma24 family protein